MLMWQGALPTACGTVGLSSLGWPTSHPVTSDEAPRLPCCQGHAATWPKPGRKLQGLADLRSVVRSGDAVRYLKYPPRRIAMSTQIFRLTVFIFSPTIAAMNFQILIAELIALSKTTQTAIAAECGCALSTINDLATGDTKKPSFDLGTKLTEMHKKAQAAARRKAAKDKA